MDLSDGRIKGKRRVHRVRSASFSSKDVYGKVCSTTMDMIVIDYCGQFLMKLKEESKLESWNFSEIMARYCQSWGILPNHPRYITDNPNGKSRGECGGDIF
jgi:hypothetical protein